MSGGPRLLALMGSGETSPTMVKTHRSLLSSVGGGPAVVLDTPFGFQSNADELTARARQYFSASVGTAIEPVRFRSVEDVGSAAYEGEMERLRRASYVFAGPGSPTYALRVWRSAGSVVPDLLRSKLRSGGCVTFASAAALTTGCVTVPVYEIYKVGEDPAWVDGLDLLAEAGVRAAVIPHFDNAEGGTHDTRFCYLGESRLSMLEESLPEGCFVLGIDEHTACVIDLDASTFSVVGNGVVTARWPGRTPATFEAGTTAPVAALSSELGAGTPNIRGSQHPVRDGGGGGGSLSGVVGRRVEAFDTAVAGGDAPAATQAVLDLEGDLEAWSTETFGTDELDQARSQFRAMVARLGELAEGGTRDVREVIGPFVEALLDARAGARADRRFSDADALRDRLVGLGVEVRDTPEGTEWAVD